MNNENNGLTEEEERVINESMRFNASLDEDIAPEILRNLIVHQYLTTYRINKLSKKIIALSKSDENFKKSFELISKDFNVLVESFIKSNESMVDTFMRGDNDEKR